MEDLYTPDSAALLAYIRNQVSAEKQIAIEQWASSSTENEKLLLDLAKIDYAQRGINSYSRWDTDAAYQKIRHQINNGKRLFQINWRMVAAAVVALFIINAGLLTVFTSSNHDVLVLSSNDEKKVEYTLPDGTHIYLNRNSSITFPVKYSKKERRIVLDGEAYFDVAHNPQKPFVVVTPNQVEIKVLGTKFNVEAYKSDSIVRTALYEGSIVATLYSGSNHAKSFRLTPSNELRFNANTGGITLRKNPTANNAEWMDNTFIFNDTPLTEVIRILSHNFDADFLVEDPQIKTYLFTGTFDNRELSIILEYMRISSGITIRADKTPSGKARYLLSKKATH